MSNLPLHTQILNAVDSLQGCEVDNIDILLDQDTPYTEYDEKNLRASYEAVIVYSKFRKQFVAGHGYDQAILCQLVEFLLNTES